MLKLLSEIHFHTKIVAKLKKRAFGLRHFQVSTFFFRKTRTRIALYSPHRWRSLPHQNIIYNAINARIYAYEHHTCNIYAYSRSRYTQQSLSVESMHPYPRNLYGFQDGDQKLHDLSVNLFPNGVQIGWGCFSGKFNQISSTGFKIPSVRIGRST